jgi:hypothetical protein
VIFRKLTGEEVQELAPIFASYDCEPPENGFVLAGYEGEELVCFQCFHQVNHAGPAWVREDKRGNGLWKQMQDELEALLPIGTYFYQFGTELNQTQLERLKMTSLGWTVWGKRKGA